MSDEALAPLSSSADSLESLAADDHRALAQRLDLLHFQDEAPGMAFWHPRGWALYRLLEDTVRAHVRAAGYHEVRTPQVMRRPIWERHGAELPAWLAPAQVAVIPVGAAHAARAAACVRALAAAGLRARLDADAATLARRVLRAHHDGVPLVVVIGNREVQHGTLSARGRERSDSWSGPAADVIGELARRCAPPPPVAVEPSAEEGARSTA